MSPVSSRSLLTIGWETEKVLGIWKSDNNNNPTKTEQQQEQGQQQRS